MIFTSFAEQRRNRRLAEPDLNQCNVVNGICTFHNRQAAECEQMVHGNLCVLCKEFHTRDTNCNTGRLRK